MSVLVACKNEENPIKNEGARVVTTLFIDFSDAQGQIAPKSEMESCRLSNSSKLLWLTLLPARMKKIHWKMKALEWSKCFSHYKSMGIFPDTAQFRTHPRFMVVLVTYKNKEEPIKTEGARVVTRFFPLQPYGSYLLQWKPEF